MSKRVLVSIGCNTYDDSGSFPMLSAGEQDAQSFHDLLLRPDCGAYDRQASALLLSPRWDAVQAAMRTALFGPGSIDTLTLFFAGHGVLKNDSLFLCVRDTQVEALSATGISLSSILQMVGEAAPAQTNIILDACQSGGLGNDLHAILRNNVLGKAGSPGVTLLAAAASDQLAFEKTDGGVLTTAVKSCVSGALFVQNHGPALDLVDIGRAASAEVSRRGGQTPLVWGLSLVGAARFCRNPRHTGATSASLLQLANAGTGGDADGVRDAIPRLYRIYEDATESLDCRSLLDAIRPLISADPSLSNDAITVVSRVQAAFEEQLRGSLDRFAAVEARAACLCALSASCGISRSSEAYVQESTLELVDSIVELLTDTLEIARREKYALLSNNGGPADLYFLPLRLTKILGWIGACILIQRDFASDDTRTTILLKSWIDLIARDYGTAFRAVSDAQAPYVSLALSACRATNLADEGEILLSMMFSSVLDCKGNVGRNDLKPSDILEYLLARSDDNWSDQRSLIAQPSELILTLLANAPDFELADEFDGQLRTLDHVHLNAFFPESWGEFAVDETVVDGMNHSLQIGHDFFRVSEIVDCLSAAPLAQPRNASVGSLAMLSSLLFPDRIAWFTWYRSRPTAIPR